MWAPYGPVMKYHLDRHMSKFTFLSKSGVSWKPILSWVADINTSPDFVGVEGLILGGGASTSRNKSIRSRQFRAVMNTGVIWMSRYIGSVKIWRIASEANNLVTSNGVWDTTETIANAPNAARLAHCIEAEARQRKIESVSSNHSLMKINIISICLHIRIITEIMRRNTLQESARSQREDLRGWLTSLAIPLQPSS